MAVPAAAAAVPDAQSTDQDGEGLQDKESGVEVNLQDLDNPDMFGWLNKYSGPLSAKRAWKRRYCVLKGRTESIVWAGSESWVLLCRHRGWHLCFVYRQRPVLLCGRERPLFGRHQSRRVRAEEVEWHNTFCHATSHWPAEGMRNDPRMHVDEAEGELFRASSFKLWRGQAKVRLA